MNLRARETRYRAQRAPSEQVTRDRTTIKAVAASLLAVGLGSPAAWADQPATVAAAERAAPGTLVGILTDAAKAPVGRVTVTVHKAGGGIRSTVSGSDGSYTFADLPSGKWTLALQAAGSSEVKPGSLTVNSDQATRYDIILDSQSPHQVAGAAHTSDGFLAKLTHAVAYVTMPSSPVFVAAADEGGGGTAAAAPAPAPVQKVPDALLAPPPPPDNDTVSPFANDGDIGWMNSCEGISTHDPATILGNGGKRDQLLIAMDAVFFF